MMAIFRIFFAINIFAADLHLGCYIILYIIVLYRISQCVCMSECANGCVICYQYGKALWSERELSARGFNRYIEWLAKHIIDG